MRPNATSAAAIRPGRMRRLARGLWIAWVSAQVAAAAPISLVFVVSFHVDSRSLRSLLLYLVTLVGLLALQQLAIHLLRRRIGPRIGPHVGPEPSTPADLLTLARASIGSTLLALAIAGSIDGTSIDRVSLLGGMAFLTALLGATALDWLDGPLARRLGPTRLGAVLDIEADSWLTLGCAGAAVAWGGLSVWVLAAPVLRYAHPVLALLRGGLPSGGGPWWSRVTGVAQMALFLGALVPIDLAGRSALLTATALPIGAAQLATMIALLVLPKSATAR